MPVAGRLTAGDDLGHGSERCPGRMIGDAAWPKGCLLKLLENEQCEHVNLFEAE